MSNAGGTRKQTKDSGKTSWTAIGVTVPTKNKLGVMKAAFEKKLNRGPQSWDNFIQALLNLGPPTWNFLITEIVKSIKTTKESCPFPQRGS
ncbi:MAG: hypothetical protein ACFFDP_03760 [Promethearchaeota archaeon]